MLITTSSLPDALESKARLRGWPGPWMLCVPPENTLSNQSLSAAMKDFYVFEFTQKTPSRMAMIREVVVRASQNLLDLKGPFLFLRHSPDKQTMSRLGKMARKNPGEVYLETDETTGEMTLLLLGSAIVSNPLFVTFFRNLMPTIEEAHTAQCLDVLRAHLVPAL